MNHSRYLGNRLRISHRLIQMADPSVGRRHETQPPARPCKAEPGRRRSDRRY